MRFSPLALSTLLLVACTTGTPATGGTVSSSTMNANASSNSRMKEVTATWETKELVPGPYDEPRFALTLKLAGDLNRTVDIGTYSGSFSSEQAKPTCKAGDTACDRILLSGKAWWAGVGDEFVVRQMPNGVLEILHREIGEGLKTPNVFTSVKVVELPATVVVEGAK